MKNRMNHLFLIILIQLITFIAYSSAAENKVEIEQHLRIAIEAVQQYRYGDAIKEYKAILELSSDEHTKQDAQYWLGLCYYYAPDLEGGDKEIAISELQKFIQKWPDSPLAPNAMYMIGRIYFGDIFSFRGRILYSKDAVHFDKAIETFENLIKKYPHSDFVDAACYMQVLAHYLKGETPSENEMGKAILTLLKGIENTEREFRWLALDILTDFGEDGAMALIELFESSDDKAFKAIVALKLAEIGETSKKEEIFKIATDEENDINIRAVATIALAKLQDKRATPLLVNYCKNSKILFAEEFRYNYLFSEPRRANFYHYYGKISVFGELQRSEIASSAMARALVEINDNRKIQMLKNLIRDNSLDKEIQMNAESVLTLLKDKETVLELRKDGNALAMDWAVLGPLDLTIIPPKSELRINAQYPKYDGASEDELLRWNTIQDVRHTKPDTLKFNPYLNIREIIVAPAAVYLMTYVNLPKKTNVKMVIGGSNKIVKVWVNDQPLQAKDKSKKLFSAQLRKGKNEVVIEAWVAVDISLRVTDIRGVPIPGLSYSCPLSEDYSTD